MVLFEKLENEEEIKRVREMMTKHYQYTGSPRAAHVLAHWEEFVAKFIKVIPKNYKLMIETIEEMERSGLSKEKALLTAFEVVAKQKKSIDIQHANLEAIAK
jgi:glutamate synthase (NADPH) large chain